MWRLPRGAFLQPDAAVPRDAGSGRIGGRTAGPRAGGGAGRGERLLRASWRGGGRAAGAPERGPVWPRPPACSLSASGPLPGYIITTTEPKAGSAVLAPRGAADAPACPCPAGPGSGPEKRAAGIPGPPPGLGARLPPGLRRRRGVLSGLLLPGGRSHRDRRHPPVPRRAVAVGPRARPSLRAASLHAVLALGVRGGSECELLLRGRSGRCPGRARGWSSVDTRTFACGAECARTAL